LIFFDFWENESSAEINPLYSSLFSFSLKFDDFVKSWFMPQTAAYEQRSGGGPDTLFQTLSKHSGGDGRRFGV